MVDREALVEQANELITTRQMNSNNLSHVVSAIALCFVALTDIAVQSQKREDEREAKYKDEEDE